MRRFRARDDIGVFALPGVGRVKPGQMFEGAEWAQFAPQYLRELLDSTPTTTPGTLLTEPSPVVASRQEEKRLEEQEGDAKIGGDQPQKGGGPLRRKVK